jgi:hypothetical protein
MCRFKQGFGGEFTPWIGAWDFPTNRVGVHGRHAEGVGCDSAATPWSVGCWPGDNLTEEGCHIIIQTV